jgi:hypothetical protein
MSKLIAWDTFLRLAEQAIQVGEYTAYPMPTSIYFEHDELGDEDSMSVTLDLLTVIDCEGFFCLEENKEQIEWLKSYGIDTSWLGA